MGQSDVNSGFNLLEDMVKTLIYICFSEFLNGGRSEGKKEKRGISKKLCLFLHI